MLMGIMFMTGFEGQWTWWGQLPQNAQGPDKVETIDYSPAMRLYFQQWLRNTYHNNQEELRKSWNRQNVTFETAPLPEEKYISETEYNQFRDPRSGITGQILDYFQAFIDCKSSVLDDWGKIIKNETRESPVLYGVFHGNMLAHFIGGGRNHMRNAFFINKSYLVVHTIKKGSRKISLPGNYQVFNLLENKYTAVKNNAITINPDGPTTYIYRLDAAGN
ncbi:MAG TPA: hypothetical protein DC049_10480 [Spirochaetia bacterium]|nr:hypothetical protein [Spirochaetia bacterium]